MPRPTPAPRPGPRAPWLRSGLAAALALGATLAAAQTLTLTKTADLAFGKLVPGTLAGTVTVPHTPGPRTATGGVTLFSQGSSHSAAAFTVSNGPSNGSCTINWPTLPLVLSFESTTLSVTTLTASVSSPFTLSGTGGSFTVGGTASVGANQTAGTYANTLTVGVTCSAP